MFKIGTKIKYESEYYQNTELVLLQIREAFGCPTDLCNRNYFAKVLIFQKLPFLSCNFTLDYKPCFCYRKNPTSESSQNSTAKSVGRKKMAALIQNITSFLK